MFDRRKFLSSAVIGMMSYRSLADSFSKKANNEVFKLKNFKAIQELDSLTTNEFNGDNITRPHDILWDTANYIQKKGGLPKPSEKRKVVVIGGGMSGLIAAYYLKELDPLVLEQDKFFGGNSKGERFKDAEYSIGSAYITIPDEHSDIDQFLIEIKAKDLLRLEADHETVFNFKNQLLKNFWKGETDLAAKDDFLRVEAELRRIFNEAYPDIPWTPESQLSKEEFLNLDGTSFKDWLKNTFGELHPHIIEYFQKYCWSSFTASMEELSAAQVLNFVAAEVDGVLALPGGNAKICDLIIDKLQQKCSPNSLIANAFTLNVEIKNHLVYVTYEDEVGKLITVEAENVVFAAPKYVAQKILKNLPDSQNKLMDKIRYRGYIVTNAFYEGNFQNPGFDVYWLNGEVPRSPSAMNPPKNYTTDVCFGTWAQQKKSNLTVFTMYRPLAFDGARQFLFSPMAHQKNLNRSMIELEGFLKAFNLKISDVKNYRLTRWGHSLPVAEVGLFKNGVIDKMNASINSKIFFANQDNFANPAFECSFAAAKISADEILKKYI